MPTAGYDLLKAKKYDPLIARLVDELGMEATADVWVNAEAWLDLMLASSPELSAGERKHVEGMILPTCAIYFAIGVALGKREAYELVSWHLREHASNWMSRYRGLFSIPGGRQLAMLWFGRVMRRAYGSESGFATDFVETSSKRLVMEVHDCPYLRWCRDCGAEELAPLFCENDDYAYGRVAGVDFRREGTLARGASQCDFDVALR